MVLRRDISWRLCSLLSFAFSFAFLPIFGNDLYDVLTLSEWENGNGGRRVSFVFYYWFCVWFVSGFDGIWQGDRVFIHSKKIPKHTDSTCWSHAYPYVVGQILSFMIHGLSHSVSVSLPVGHPLPTDSLTPN